MSDTTTTAPAGETLPEMTAEHVDAIGDALSSVACHYEEHGGDDKPVLKRLRKIRRVIRSLSKGETKLFDPKIHVAVSRDELKEWRLLANVFEAKGLIAAIDRWLGRDE